MRKEIESGTKLRLVSEISENRSRFFVILKKLGEGASCIGYEALDSETGISFVLKECFPVDAMRDSEGNVIWPDAVFMAKSKARFRKSFEIQRQIQSIKEFSNTNSHLVDSLYFANKTLYTITDWRNTKPYSECKDKNLGDTFLTARSIARSVDVYHQNGYLFLDLKPQNIMIYQETRDLVLLIDFDSIVEKTGITSSETKISYSTDYAAPELTQGKHNKICEASDIYSVGAIIFERIFGRIPTSQDRGTFSDWNFEEMPEFRKYSRKLSRLTKDVLHRTLSASVKNRFQNMDELISALTELIYEYEHGSCHLVESSLESLNLFVGRDTELTEVHHSLRSTNAVFVCGMGGMGKTELALNYAKRYHEEYDVIVFGDCSSGIRKYISNKEVVSITNYDEPITLSILQQFVDEKTLFIVDNLEDSVDEDLQKFLSLPCKKIFTLREDLSEFIPSAHHLILNELPLEGQRQLFEEIYGEPVDPEIMDRLLGCLDGLTLPISLIAKQAKNGLRSLEELSGALVAEGIVSTQKVKVKHFKDRNFYDTTYEILRRVFRLSDFSEEEESVICSVILLDHIIISKKEFLSWIGEEKLDVFNELVSKGWITCRRKGDESVIGIHVILKEIFDEELAPCLSACTELKDKIYEFVKKTSYIGHSFLRKPDLWGYVSVGLTHLEEERYISNVTFITSVFDLVDPELEPELWTDIIRKVSNTLYDIPEFREFLEEWIKHSINPILDVVLNYETSFLDAFITLGIMNMREDSRMALRYFLRADTYIQELEKIGVIVPEKKQLAVFLDPCIAYYQQLCAKLNDQYPGGDPFWYKIDAFYDLNDYIDGLWTKALDLMKECKQKEIIRNAYNDFRRIISFEFCEKMNILCKDDPFSYSSLDWDEMADDLDDEPEEEYINPARIAKKTPKPHISENDLKVYEQAIDINQRLSKLIGATYLPPGRGQLLLMSKVDWDEDEKEVVRREIHHLDVFEDIYIPENTSWSNIIAQLCIIEAQLACVYSLIDDEERPRQHLEKMLRYFRMYYAEGNQGHFFSVNLSTQPGIAAVLNRNVKIIDDNLTVWFMKELYNIFESADFDLNSLVSVVDSGILMAIRARDNEAKRYFNERKKKLVGINFDFK